MRLREVGRQLGQERKKEAGSENPGRLREGFAGAFVAAQASGLYCVGFFFFFKNVVWLLVFPLRVGHIFPFLIFAVARSLKR